MDGLGEAVHHCTGHDVLELAGERAFAVAVFEGDLDDDTLRRVVRDDACVLVSVDAEVRAGGRACQPCDVPDVVAVVPAVLVEADVRVARHPKVDAW